jgi:hypothetical protein
MLQQQNNAGLAPALFVDDKAEFWKRTTSVLPQRA